MNTESKWVKRFGYVMTGAVLLQAGHWARSLDSQASISDKPTSTETSTTSTSNSTSSPAAAPTNTKISSVTGEPADLNIFVKLAKLAVPSVVNISTITNVKSSLPPGATPEEFFNQFFGGGGGGLPMAPRRPNKTMALGSGFVIDPKGIILTNNHVVGQADEIKIQFTEDPNEKPTEGKVIGRDKELDVALIRVKTDKKLTALKLGDSEALEVGEYVMAVGNPFGNGHSVSHGIVSAKGRMSPGIPLASYIQIDAPINPGNSGGPLLNLKGDVVGINNAIDARGQGIGFAIPINYVKKVLAQLENDGKVKRSYIGAIVGPLSAEIAEKIGVDKELDAPFVTQVAPGSPAFKAGLRAYDVITEVNGVRIHNPSEMVQAVISAPAGTTLPFKISRGGEVKTLQIRTSERPDEDRIAMRD